MASKYDLAFRDYGKETSTVGVLGTTLTAANFDAQVALMAALRTAIEAMVVGETASRKIIALEEVISADPAASGLAQRENKWLVRYTDGTNVFTLEIPTADLTLLENNSEFLSLTGTEGSDFVTAFEAYCVRNGQAVTVLDIQFVGRNI